MASTTVLVLVYVCCFSFYCSAFISSDMNNKRSGKPVPKNGMDVNKENRKGPGDGKQTLKFLYWYVVWVPSLADCPSTRSCRVTVLSGERAPGIFFFFFPSAWAGDEQYGFNTFRTVTKMFETGTRSLINPTAYA